MDGECSTGDNQESILNHQTSEPRYMTYEYLENITNFFSEEIGRGSYGVVYKGVEDGKTIAVKKFESKFDEKKFMKEVNYLKMLNHKNIVPYIGYCNEKPKREQIHNGKLILVEEPPHMLLCMEYLPKGNLRRHIADKSFRLDWWKWYTIIEGISQGLNYLLGQNPPVTHLDLKPENILLDDNMEPKVADFGLSRLLFGNNTIKTASFTGTLGYMPPEYIDEQKISTRFDIFSFGVIILEIIAGHRMYPAVNETPDDFIEIQLKEWGEKRLKKQDNASFEIDCRQIKRCIRIGLLCVHPDRTMRPEMKVIIQLLRDYLQEDVSVAKELILVEPRELRFCLEPNKRIRCLVNITNGTHQHVRFHCRVKKAASNHYSFEPEEGTLCPLGTLTVSFLIEELGELPLDFLCHDQLLVMSTEMPDVKPLPTSMRHKVNLTVVYERPVRPVQPPSVPRTDFPENQYMDILINCIRQNLGFFNGRPIAACVVYRCLLQWKSFEAERTNHFDRIMTCMHSAVYDQGYSELAYWLSNSCTLLVLMQRTFETATTTIFGPRRRLKSAELLKRIIEGNPGFRNTHLIEELSGQKARRPAMLFNGHLISFLEKVYETMMDHLTQELRQLFFCTITEPRISQTLFDHWQVIEQILTKYSTDLKSNYVPPFLFSKFFTQVFSHINAQLFNILLRQKKCYYSSNAKYVKAGLESLKVWCSSQTEEYAGSSWKQLRHIREAALFLVVGGKSKKTLTDISNLCPVLSKPHLYQIITMHSANTDSSNTVSREVSLFATSVGLANPRSQEFHFSRTF